jgi:hypothetical protein
MQRNDRFQSSQRALTCSPHTALLHSLELQYSCLSRGGIGDASTIVGDTPQFVCCSIKRLALESSRASYKYKVTHVEITSSVRGDKTTNRAVSTTRIDDKALISYLLSLKISL